LQLRKTDPDRGSKKQRDLKKLKEENAPSDITTAEFIRTIRLQILNDIISGTWFFERRKGDLT
jgi:hypothetical protein